MPYADATSSHMCLTCGFIYDEATGLPGQGIAPGTALSDLPVDWVCPDCGQPRDSFETVD
ncbi:MULTISPECIES: rubredoxin [Thauera]|nr:MULTISPECIES: rubredoxin [Thauera]ENO81133.1 Rubredoxin-type Fe(Cys)4 protein [Thauera sp. 27]